ncbi:hypothetical protein AGMMS49983_10160 [Clostridia bacterium]|nr:hypothetical protein AGMMS49983_10160 [Clostridia bacterium]
MPHRVTLTIRRGESDKRQYTYVGKARLIIGRGGDCTIVLKNGTVSSRHCLVEIEPDTIVARDFGSLNGTYLNGRKMGGRRGGPEATKDSQPDCPAFALTSGDILGLGRECEILIEMADIPPVWGSCERCGRRLAEGEAEFCADCLADSAGILSHLRERIEKSPYRKIELLGEGTMGQVWLVEDKQSMEQFAMRILHTGDAVSDDANTLFLRRQNLASQLNHPHIVRQYDCQQTTDGFYIRMEYMSGRSAAYQMRQRGGKLDRELATGIILQTLDALIYAHEAALLDAAPGGKAEPVMGPVHRNLTPGNILLDDRGQATVAKVSNFGLRTALDTSGLSGNDDTGSVPCSPLFLCRKQIIDYAYTDPSADVWAAAACYYAMLTGRYVKDFTSQTRLGVFSDLLKNAIVPIRERDPSIPEGLAEVIDYALIEEPEMRVTRAAQLKKMIEDAL